MQSSCLIALFCLFALCASASAHLSKPPTRDGTPLIPCATDEVYEHRLKQLKLSGLNNVASALGNCTRGKCDNVAVRDEEGSTNTVIKITTAVHLMNSLSGQGPNGVDEEQVVSMMTRMNENFGSYGFYFDYTIYPHNDNAYHCIPAYSGFNQDWLDAIDNMKKEYALSPSSTLNIFISCQQASIQGTLFGIGTFPWDSAALTATGGLWLNGISVNKTAQLDGDITAEHETGHCLGLWHTFHGSDEVLGCNLECEELPHSGISPENNEKGDLCSDTPATPRNYACSDPRGTACNGSPWGATDFDNYMAYGMDPQPCGNHFTTQQKYRMRCWVCDALSGWASSGC